ncbi:hypothetical protein CHUAL_011478 [Chamberlinius hualienensis]
MLSPNRKLSSDNTEDTGYTEESEERVIGENENEPDAEQTEKVEMEEKDQLDEESLEKVRDNSITNEEYSVEGNENEKDDVQSVNENAVNDEVEPMENNEEAEKELPDSEELKQDISEDEELENKEETFVEEETSNVPKNTEAEDEELKEDATGEENKNEQIEDKETEVRQLSVDGIERQEEEDNEDSKQMQTEDQYDEEKAIESETFSNVEKEDPYDEPKDEEQPYDKEESNYAEELKEKDEEEPKEEDEAKNLDVSEVDEEPKEEVESKEEEDSNEIRSKVDVIIEEETEAEVADDLNKLETEALNEESDSNGQLQIHRDILDAKLESQISVESDGDVVMSLANGIPNDSEADATPSETVLGFSTPWSMEGDYLTAVLGDALILSMAEVSKAKPSDPIAYLALLLYRYIHISSLNATDSKVRRKLVNGQLTIKELSELKAENGSTLVHFAAETNHEDSKAFAQLLSQSRFNMATRDGNSQTVRDAAQKAGQEELMNDVDNHVFQQVRKGHLHAIETLIYDGYDHLLDIMDDEGNDVIMIAELTHQVVMAQMLKKAHKTQEAVQALYKEIEEGNVEAVKSLLDDDPKLILAKNPNGQSAVHLAMLSENEQLVQLLATYSTQVVHSSDNVSEEKDGKDSPSLRDGDK